MENETTENRERINFLVELFRDQTGFITDCSTEERWTQVPFLFPIGNYLEEDMTFFRRFYHNHDNIGGANFHYQNFLRTYSELSGGVSEDEIEELQIVLEETRNDSGRMGDLFGLFRPLHESYCTVLWRANNHALREYSQSLLEVSRLIAEENQINPNSVRIAPSRSLEDIWQAHYRIPVDTNWLLERIVRTEREASLFSEDISNNVYGLFQASSQNSGNVIERRVIVENNREEAEQNLQPHIHRAEYRRNHYVFTIFPSLQELRNGLLPDNLSDLFLESNDYGGGLQRGLFGFLNFLYEDILH